MSDFPTKDLVYPPKSNLLHMASYKNTKKAFDENYIGYERATVAPSRKKHWADGISSDPDSCEGSHSNSHRDNNNKNPPRIINGLFKDLKRPTELSNGHIHLGQKHPKNQDHEYDHSKKKGYWTSEKENKLNKSLVTQPQTRQNDLNSSFENSQLQEKIFKTVLHPKNLPKSKLDQNVDKLIQIIKQQRQTSNKSKKNFEDNLKYPISNYAKVIQYGKYNKINKMKIGKLNILKKINKIQNTKAQKALKTTIKELDSQHPSSPIKNTPKPLYTRKNVNINPNLPAQINFYEKIHNEDNFIEPSSPKNKSQSPTGSKIKKPIKGLNLNIRGQADHSALQAGKPYSHRAQTAEKQRPNPIQHNRSLKNEDFEGSLNNSTQNRNKKCKSSAKKDRISTPVGNRTMKHLLEEQIAENKKLLNSFSNKKGKPQFDGRSRNQNFMNFHTYNSHIGGMKIGMFNTSAAQIASQPYGKFNNKNGPINPNTYQIITGTKNTPAKNSFKTPNSRTIERNMFVTNPSTTTCKNAKWKTKEIPSQIKKYTIHGQDNGTKTSAQNSGGRMSKSKIRKGDEMVKIIKAYQIGNPSVVNYLQDDFNDNSKKNTWTKNSAKDSQKSHPDNNEKILRKLHDGLEAAWNRENLSRNAQPGSLRTQVTGPKYTYENSQINVNKTFDTSAHNYQKIGDLEIQVNDDERQQIWDELDARLQRNSNSKKIDSPNRPKPSREDLNHVQRPVEYIRPNPVKVNNYQIDSDLIHTGDIQSQMRELRSTTGGISESQRSKNAYGTIPTSGTINEEEFYELEEDTSKGSNRLNKENLDKLKEMVTNHVSEAYSRINMAKQPQNEKDNRTRNIFQKNSVSVLVPKKLKFDSDDEDDNSERSFGSIECLSDDDCNLTVIENDCDNDYSLIFNSLRTMYYF